MPDDDDAGAVAEVVGNRAGVVEWANDAFSRLTAIPLCEIVNKPVTRFLERAGVEVEVVDFVAQHFFEGRPCRLELPFDRPDGRRIDVLLEVEPLRDADGEIERFRATAQERFQPSDQTPIPARAGDPTALRAGALPLATGRSRETPPTPLAPAIRRVVAVETGAPNGGRVEHDAWLLDLALTSEPLAIRCAEADLERLVADLLQAARAALALADQAWGTVTLTTGRTTPSRRFRSKVHAIPAFPAELAGACRIYLEIHDTGEPLPADTIARLFDDDPRPRAADWTADAARTVDPREAALGRALARARALGASVHLDGTPGCGNQALVLFPA